MSEELKYIPEVDPMLAGLDGEAAAAVQKELEHLAIPVQSTAAENPATGEPSAPGSNAEQPTPETPPNGPPPPPVNSDPNGTNAAREHEKRVRAAVRYAKMNDLTASTVIGMIKNISSSHFRANNEELKSLVDAWEDFLLENQDFKIPGYVQLIIANVTIYAIRAFGADIMRMATGGKKDEGAKDVSPQQPPPPSAQGNPVPTAPPRPPDPVIQYASASNPPAVRQNSQPSYEDAKIVSEVAHPGLHKCALPDCQKRIPLKKKFCGKSHSTMWLNFTKRGIPIDPNKV